MGTLSTIDGAGEVIAAFARAIECALNADAAIKCAEANLDNTHRVAQGADMALEFAVENTAEAVGVDVATSGPFNAFFRVLVAQLGRPSTGRTASSRQRRGGR